jgi:hypothetical protein
VGGILRGRFNFFDDFVCLCPGIGGTQLEVGNELGDGVDIDSKIVSETLHVRRAVEAYIGIRLTDALERRERTWEGPDFGDPIAILLVDVCNRHDTNGKEYLDKQCQIRD